MYFAYESNAPIADTRADTARAGAAGETFVVRDGGEVSRAGTATLRHAGVPLAYTSTGEKILECKSDSSDDSESWACMPKNNYDDHDHDHDVSHNLTHAVDNGITHSAVATTTMTTVAGANITAVAPTTAPVLTWSKLGFSKENPSVGIGTLTFAFVCFVVFARRFMCNRNTMSARIIKERERKKILAAMGTAIAWRKTALAKRAEEDEKKKKNATKNNEKKSNGGDDEEKPKSQAQLDEELETQMPSAEKLYDLLYDKHEHRRTNYYGLKETTKGADKVRAVERLLAMAVRRELREATEKTSMARDELPLLPWMEPSEVAPFRDGLRLTETVERTRDQIYWHLGGKNGVPNLREDTKAEFDKATHQLKVYANQRTS